MTKDRKDIYRELCDSAKVPLFSQAWWLDTIMGPDWDVCVVETHGDILGALPYQRRRVGPFLLSGQPPLTQTLGPWVRPDLFESTTEYRKVIGSLINQLPKFARFQQNLHHVHQDWLPFYWSGFKQTTRYSYVLDDLSDLPRLWAGLKPNLRRDITRARDRAGLRANLGQDIQTFLGLNRSVFARQGHALPYSEDLVARIHNEAQRRNACELWMVAQEDGTELAGALILYDRNTAYYLLSGTSDKGRETRANSLCLWTSIESAADRASRFDFEGSMIEPIERYIRAFGARRFAYFQLTHHQGRWLAALDAWRSFGGRR